MRRYVEHFKVLPVGSLALFSSDQLAWILRLDDSGAPAEVVLAQAAEPPMRDNLGSVLRGDVFERLGIAEHICSTLNDEQHDWLFFLAVVTPYKGVPTNDLHSRWHR